MKILFALFFTVCVTFVSFSCASDAARSWTSKDGTESVDGTFHSLDNGIVTILLPNQRSLKFPLKNLREEDARYAEEAAATKKTVAPAAAASLGKLGEKLNNNLVDDSGRAVDLAGRAGGPPKYYVLYYSASWCPPCRQYTPELVRWYSRSKSKYPVETVLIPADKSEKDMLQYMSDYRMRFPGLKFDAKGSNWVPRSGGRGIPALLLVDAEGNRLLSSQEVSRSDFLKEAEKRMAN